MNGIPIPSEYVRRAAGATIVTVLACFVAWWSWVPEPLQLRWDVFRYALAACVCLSWMRYGFAVRGYVVAADTRVVWGYLAALAVCVPWAYARWYVAWQYLEIAGSAAALYWLITRECPFGVLRRLCGVLAACAAAVVVLGCYEMIARANPLYAQWHVPSFCYGRYVGVRMMATMVHPNVLGLYCIVCLPIAWYFRLHGVSRLRRSGGAVAAGLCVAGVAFSFARGSWLAALVMVLVFAVRRRRYGRAAAVAAAVAAVVIGSSLPHAPRALQTRFSDVAVWNYFLGYRSQQVEATAAIVRRYPLTGLGINNYRLRYREFSPTYFRYEFRVPDSLYLWHVAETGLVGTAGFLLLVAAFFARVRRGLARATSRAHRGLLAACAYAMVGYLVNAASFDTFMWRAPLYLFWFLFASASALALGERE